MCVEMVHSVTVSNALNKVLLREETPSEQQGQSAYCGYHGLFPRRKMKVMWEHGVSAGLHTAVVGRTGPWWRVLPFCRISCPSCKVDLPAPDSLSLVLFEDDCSVSYRKQP